MGYAGMSARTRTSQFRITLLPEWDKDRPSAIAAVRTRVGAPAPSLISSASTTKKPATTPSATTRTTKPLAQTNPDLPPSVFTGGASPAANSKVSRIYEVSFTPPTTEDEASATLEIKADQIPSETTLPVRLWVKDDTVGIDFWNSPVPAQVIEDLRDSIKDTKTPYGRLFSDVTYTKLSGNASRLVFTTREPVSFLAKMGRTASGNFRIHITSQARRVTRRRCRQRAIRQTRRRRPRSRRHRCRQ
jgi:hypothetical protein